MCHFRTGKPSLRVFRRFFVRQRFQLPARVVCVFFTRSAGICYFLLLSVGEICVSRRFSGGCHGVKAFGFVVYFRSHVAFRVRRRFGVISRKLPGCVR